MAEFAKGMKVHYWPLEKLSPDNEHWPAEIIEVGKRIKIFFRSAEHPDGVTRSVAKKRLAIHDELF